MTPTNESEVIATFVQAILYGLYIATLAHGLRWIMYDDEGWKLRKIINWPLVALTLLIFALSTADLGVLLQITIDDVVGGSTPALQRLNDVIVALEQVTLLTTEALFVYRCSAIHEKDWRIICVPFVLFFASIVLAMLDIVFRAMDISKVTNDTTWNPSRFSWLWVVFICLSIVITVYCSVIILRHFLRTSSESKIKLARLHKTCLLIAEAGLVFTPMGLLNLIALVVTRNGDVLVSITCDAIHFSAAGIAFNLLLIRIYQERAFPKMTGTVINSEKRMSLSALQFNAGTLTTQSRSAAFVDSEQARETRVSFVDATQ
jgi:hypothetical protein